jgi:hypothetical protein
VTKIASASVSLNEYYKTIYLFDMNFQVRLLAEKVSDQPESHDDKEKKVEFSVPTWQVWEFSIPTWQVRRFSVST